MSKLPARWADEVLRFWFEECSPQQWFKKDDAFDALLRQRFLTLHGEIAATPTAALTADPRTALAAVLVLDQFSRNMFRGTPKAFASDDKALAIAEAAVARGFDAGLSTPERQFFYLPFEHCESAEAQARCVALFSALGDPELTKWAEAHKVIIDRFGRFPHRNAILGRASTPEELAFLLESGSSF
jgi:uncharacterized protein (DUF924 family)